MIISDDLKQIYKTNAYPLVDELARIELVIDFPGLDITITGEQIQDDSFSLKEFICESGDIEFGTCYASTLKVTIDELEVNIKGQKMIVTQIVNDSDVVHLGTFYVYSAKLTDDNTYRDIVAYDKLAYIDVDVAEWYNSLDFSHLTLGQFRTLLLAYLDIVEEDTNLPLPNDNMLLEKTITPSQISAKEVLYCIEQINGVFGHMTRENKFTHIILPELYGDYPTEDYPLEDYPVEENNEEVYADGIINVRFEEYACKAIDKLQIRQEENDIGCIVGEGTNTYVIEGNFLVFGKNHEELTIIANNIVPYILDREYRPYEAQALGMPFIEVGDLIKFYNNETVRGYVFNRTLTGVNALRDEYSATGNEELEQNFDLNKEIIIANGKMTRIIKTVDQVKVTVEDTKQELLGEIEVIAGQVVLKVDTSGNLGYVALTADPNDGMTHVKIKANSIELEGLVTLNGNVKVLEDGTLEAVNAKFSGQITGSEIYGSIIETYGNDGLIRSTSWDGNEQGVYGYDITIQNGSMTATRTFYHSSGYTSTTGSSLTHDTLTTKHIIADSIDSDIIGSHDSMFYFLNMHGVNGAVQINSDTSNPYIFVGGQYGSVALRDGDVACNTINNYTPITSGNKNSYTYPPSSHDHSDYVMVLNDLALRISALENA